MSENVQKNGCLSGEMLSRLADQELSEKEAAQAKRHLFQCRTCEQRYEACIRIDSVLRTFFLFQKETMPASGPSADCLSRWTLSRYFKGPHLSSERARVEKHLAKCSHCTHKLVALHGYVKKLDGLVLKPIVREALDEMQEEMNDLLRKAQANASSAQETIENNCTQTGQPNVHEDCDHETTIERQPYCGHFTAGKMRLVASFVGLALIGSVVAAGIAVYRNQRVDVSRRAATDEVNTLSGTGEESVLTVHFGDLVEEEIEVFGQVAVYDEEPERFEMPENVERIARALIREYYYDESAAERALEREEVWDVFAMLNRLETRGPDSSSLPKSPNRVWSPDQISVLKDELSGSFPGIGIALLETPGGARIVGFAAADSLAEEAGLQMGDIVTEVDGKPLYGLALSQMVALIRGPVNTDVRLKVAREGVPDFEVWVSRERSTILTIGHRLLTTDAAYVKVGGFGDKVPGDLKKVLIGFRNSGVARLILDLRGNTGGSIQATVDTAGLFLSEGALIAKMFGANVERRHYAKDEAIWKGALSVLVDDETMSGGELLAAALKGNQRATVIGERTAGKGSVQTIYRFTGDYAVQMTTNVLEGPDRLAFNNYGVEPDVMVDAAGSNDFLPQYGEVPDDMAIRVALSSFDGASTGSERRPRAQ